MSNGILSPLTKCNNYNSFHLGEEKQINKYLYFLVFATLSRHNDSKFPQISDVSTIAIVSQTFW